MKWKITLALTILMSISALFLANAQTTITDVNPRIKANFNETILIEEATFFNKDLLIFIDALYDSDDGMHFTFFPARALPNGVYDLVIVASDLLGNSDTFRHEFKVNLSAPTIFLWLPNPTGYANSTNFDVQIIIGGVRSATCKYKASVIEDYNQPGLAVFDGVGGYIHTIYDYSVPIDNPRPLFILCEDELTRRFTEAFMLYADITKPTLQNIRFNPSPVVEYPLRGDIKTEMSAFTNEPVRCRYSDDPDTDYDSMTKFELIEDLEGITELSSQAELLNQYRDTSTTTLIFPLNTSVKKFVYYVQCEDRAAWKTEKIRAEVDVDLTALLGVNVISPPLASKETAVQINISTNKLGYCRYKTETQAYSDMSSNYSEVSRYHTIPPLILPSGTYTYTFYCISDQSGATEDVEQPYTFVIDTNAPTAPVVNTTGKACGNIVRATATATDDLSGIDTYIWEFKSAGQVVATGNSSDGVLEVTKDDSGKDLELLPDISYSFSVRAVDGAGNEGPVGNSAPILYDATGITCDVTPPIVTLIRSFDGYSATLECTDDITGCSYYQYGTTTQEPCNATTYAYPPFSIPIFFTTIVCWEVGDAAGNIAKGSEIVEINVSGAECLGGLDNDGDGYGERCLNGPDCDDTNPNEFINCASGCTQDTDGDGYGAGCILGNDCNGHDENLTTICPNGCVSDNDGDGHGLGCEDGPDCDGTDSTVFAECPSGCLDDNDGDKFGLLCPAGLDCNGENPKETSFCENMCISDLDGDSYGLGCANGNDCAGRDTSLSTTCDNGCIIDEDNDGFGLGCFAGLDTDGLNPFITDVSPNGCISDNDGDGRGMGCDAGPDCDDTDPSEGASCVNGCVQDSDGDGYGLGCELGPDCAGFDASIAVNCSNGCIVDEDGDGLGLGCDAGNDCDGMDPKISTNCTNGCLVDNDGDDFGFMCDAGIDCNDLDPIFSTECPSGCTQDLDGDGYGLCCEPGKDCDEFDPSITNGCAIGCTLDADCDQMYDAWESENDLDNTTDDSALDPDGDEFTNLEEYCAGKDPNVIDEQDEEEEDPDKDKDGMLDECELAYPGVLDPEVDDAYEDYDSDGIVNIDECNYPGATCIMGTNPGEADTDFDGHGDKKEIDKGSDPCDPDSKPGGFPIGLILIILGLIMILCGTAWGIYKKYYIPLIAPKPTPKTSKPAQQAPGMLRQRMPTTVKSLFKRRPKPKQQSLVSSDKFYEAQREKAEKRLKVFDAFGKMKEDEAKKMMERLSKKPTKETVKVIRPVYHEAHLEVKKKLAAKVGDDQVSKLSKIIAGDSFDRLNKLSKVEADEFQELATIVHDKKIKKEKLVKSEVDKLANITEAITKSKPKKEAVKNVIEKSDFDILAALPSKKGKLDELLGEVEKPGAGDAFAALHSITEPKTKPSAVDKMARLTQVESKDELMDMFKDISEGGKVDKNVFQVILSYLIKSGKLSKRDVSEMLFTLESQNVLSKKDISDVFFNLGIKHD